MHRTSARLALSLTLSTLPTSTSLKFARTTTPRALLTGATGPLSGSMPADFALPDGRKGIIMFDGVCNFCNRWVSFVLDNDPDGLFAFASLQSDAGRELLSKCGRDDSDLSTFVVIDDQGFHTQSDAALRVAATLKKPALNVMATAFSPVPSPLRDGVYRLVANNRYSILGKDESGGVESCKLRADAMTVQERFLG
jgi:predicted DCC family thiol-disulfide oxidoreductase YuxK